MIARNTLNHKNLLNDRKEWSKVVSTWIQLNQEHWSHRVWWPGGPSIYVENCLLQWHCGLLKADNMKIGKRLWNSLNTKRSRNARCSERVYVEFIDCRNSNLRTWPGLTWVVPARDLALRPPAFMIWLEIECQWSQHVTVCPAAAARGRPRPATGRHAAAAAAAEA